MASEGALIPKHTGNGGLLGVELGRAVHNQRTAIFTQRNAEAHADFDTEITGNNNCSFRIQRNKYCVCCNAELCNRYRG